MGKFIKKKNTTSLEYTTLDDAYATFEKKIASCLRKQNNIEQQIIDKRKEVATAYSTLAKKRTELKDLTDGTAVVKAKNEERYYRGWYDRFKEENENGKNSL